MDKYLKPVYSSWAMVADYDELERSMEYFARCVAKVYERKWDVECHRVVDTHHSRIVIESTGVTENTI